MRDFYIKTIKILDTESKELTARIAREFMKQVKEVEEVGKDNWNQCKLTTSPRKTKPPEKYFFKFKNGETIGAQRFITSVAFGAGIFLADKSHLKKRTYYLPIEKRLAHYEKSVPLNCSEVWLVTNFPYTIIYRIAKDLLEYAPIDLIINKEEPEVITGKNPDEEPKRIRRAMDVRLNQAAFRGILLKQYKSTCMITGCNIEAALEAAHIEPFAKNKNKNDTLENGLLLRADLHLLFDKKFMGIDPNTGDPNTGIVYFRDTDENYDDYAEKPVDISNVSGKNLNERWKIFNKAKNKN